MAKPLGAAVRSVIADLKGIKEVKAIYLFGSYAKGRALPMSDIDICAITDKDVSNTVRVDITSNSSEKIDVSFFWDLPITMRYRVLKEGRLLFVRDEKSLHNTIIKTLREYFDFLPVVKRFAQAVGVGYG